MVRGGLKCAERSRGSSGKGVCMKQVHPPQGSKDLATWESTQV